MDTSWNFYQNITLESSFWTSFRLLLRFLTKWWNGENVIHLDQALTVAFGSICRKAIGASRPAEAKASRMWRRYFANRPKDKTMLD